MLRKVTDQWLVAIVLLSGSMLAQADEPVDFLQIEPVDKNGQQAVAQSHSPPGYPRHDPVGLSGPGNQPAQQQLQFSAIFPERASERAFPAGRSDGWPSFFPGNRTR